MNDVGSRAPTKAAAAATITRNARLNPDFRISTGQNVRYPSGALAKPRLNRWKNRARGPLFSVFGFSRSAHSAGLSESALNAENRTEMAMVTANCWYNLPVIPEMNTVGTKTAVRITAMAMTGPDTSSMAFSE